MPLVDPFKQVVQCQCHKDKQGLAGEVCKHAEPKQGLVGRNVVGSGGCVSVYQQFARNIKEGEKSGERRQQVQQTCESAWVPDEAHVSPIRMYPQSEFTLRYVKARQKVHQPTSIQRCGSRISNWKGAGDRRLSRFAKRIQEPCYSVG